MGRSFHPQCYRCEVSPGVVQGRCCPSPQPAHQLCLSCNYIKLYGSATIISALGDYTMPTVVYKGKVVVVHASFAL